MHGSLLLHSRPPSAPAIRQGVVCIIPTVGRSMPPKTIAPSCKSTVSPAPWAGAAIPTTIGEGLTGDDCDDHRQQHIARATVTELRADRKLQSRQVHCSLEH